VKTQQSLSYRKLSSELIMLFSLFSHLTVHKLSFSLPNPHFSDFTPNGFNIEISGFRCGVVEAFALLRCYAAYVGSWLRTIGDNFAVQFSSAILISKFLRHPFWYYWRREVGSYTAMAISNCKRFKKILLSLQKKSVRGGQTRDMKTLSAFLYKIKEVS